MDSTYKCVIQQAVPAVALQSILHWKVVCSSEFGLINYSYIMGVIFRHKATFSCVNIVETTVCPYLDDSISNN